MGWLQAVLSSPQIPSPHPPHPPPNLCTRAGIVPPRPTDAGCGDRESHPLPQSPAERLSPRATAEQDRLAWRGFEGAGGARSPHGGGPGCSWVDLAVVVFEK